MSQDQTTPSTRPVQIEDVPGAARFEARVSGELAGLLAYQRKPGLLALIHTETEPRFEGHGVGSALAQAALAEAREEQLEVLPFCPFVNGYIQRHPEDDDLVPAAYRASFGI